MLKYRLETDLLSKTSPFYSPFSDSSYVNACFPLSRNQSYYFFASKQLKHLVLELSAKQFYQGLLLFLFCNFNICYIFCTSLELHNIHIHSA